MDSIFKRQAFIYIPVNRYVNFQRSFRPLIYWNSPTFITKIHHYQGAISNLKRSRVDLPVARHRQSVTISGIPVLDPYRRFKLSLRRLSKSRCRS